MVIDYFGWGWRPLIISVVLWFWIYELCHLFFVNVIVEDLMFYEKQMIIIYLLNFLINILQEKL